MTNEIKQAQKSISFLIDNCLQNFSVEQLEKVKDRHSMLIKQQMFWIQQDNIERFYYDLKEYGIWLCDFIADVERSTWGDEDWKDYS
tara:strand:- start:450 stop:710 length:261 start_codon:yes stop_codon:yes gene_type:complete